MELRERQSFLADEGHSEIHGRKSSSSGNSISQTRLSMNRGLQRLKRPVL